MNLDNKIALFQGVSTVSLLSHLSNYRDDSVTAPWSVEAAVRGDVLFLLNYLEEDVEIFFRNEVTDMLSGKKISGKYYLPGFGVLAVTGWNK